MCKTDIKYVNLVEGGHYHVGHQHVGAGNGSTPKYLEFYLFIIFLMNMLYLSFSQLQYILNTLCTMFIQPDQS